MSSGLHKSFNPLSHLTLAEEGNTPQGLTKVSSETKPDMTTEKNKLLRCWHNYYKLRVTETHSTVTAEDGIQQPLAEPERWVHGKQQQHPPDCWELRSRLYSDNSVDFYKTKIFQNCNISIAKWGQVQRQHFLAKVIFKARSNWCNAGEVALLKKKKKATCGHLYY